MTRGGKVRRLAEPDRVRFYVVAAQPEASPYLSNRAFSSDCGKKFSRRGNQFQN
jgi:hypothetical protein